MAEVTVFIPCYNAELFIREAIESILNQTFQQFEILVIDDCSTDGSVSIIESINDDRIRLIRNEQNLGIVGVLNKGFDLVKTKYMVRQDADDISLPSRLEVLVSRMRLNGNIDICGSGFSTFPKETTVFHPVDHETICARLLSYTSIAHCTAIFRMEKIKQYGCRYSLEYAYAEDFHFFCRYSTILTYANVETKEYCYRVHNAQISSVKSELQSQVHNQILSEYIKTSFKYTIDPDSAHIYLRPIAKKIGDSHITELIKLYKIILRKTRKDLAYRGLFRRNLKIVFGNSNINLYGKMRLIMFYFSI